MMKTRIAGILLAVGLSLGAYSQIVVRIGPPRAQVERRPPPPARGYVWIPGYQNWNGNGHQWVPGHWEQPPDRRHSRWQKHHWERRNGGWVLVEGRWR